MRLSAPADAFVWSDVCAGALMRWCVDLLRALHVSVAAAPPAILAVASSVVSNVPVTQTIECKQNRKTNKSKRKKILKR